MQVAPLAPVDATSIAQVKWDQFAMTASTSDWLAADESQYLIEVVGLSKSFPGVRALSSLNFSLRAGEVHAVCGENGAGKSTLMRILAGNMRPDEGTVRFRGEEVHFRNPADAKRKGILLIHQELSLVPELTVAENIFLGSLPTKGLGRVDWSVLRTKTEAVLEGYGRSLLPRDIVGDLSIAEQQMVEIARADAFQASVVIFDEPTASLTEREAELLFEIIGRLKARGVGVVYISHKLKEVMRISDRVTVLRDGTLSGMVETRGTSEDEITRLMVGRDLQHYFDKAETHPGKEVLRVEGLTAAGSFEDITFSVREGEVLGLCGLIGAGRSEIAEAVFGVRSHERGIVKWDGQPVDIRNSRDAINLGICLVPEDRKGQGLVLGMGARDNTTLSLLIRSWELALLNSKEDASIFATYKEQLSISVASPSQQVGTLSGGNQQKIVIAKWLALRPRLLILDEPTRGIDVGAKAEIHRLVGRLAKEGLAVILISSEMPEVIGVSHRILTLYRGRITGEFVGDQATEERLISAITGTSAAESVPSRADVRLH